LKASLDGENVVLKGFVMNNFAQRKGSLTAEFHCSYRSQSHMGIYMHVNVYVTGFERELHVLSKLKNDSIICPGAIVEGSGSGQDCVSFEYK
jgi:hypothetical protein